MNKLNLVAVGLCAAVFAVLIPILEVNPSHLTNPLWPEHARLHEAWQLLSNAGLSLFALYLVRTKATEMAGIIIALIIPVSFLIAWALGGVYGGSMLHTDGTQMAVAGINVAVIVVVALTALLGIAFLKTTKSRI